MRIVFDKDEKGCAVCTADGGKISFAVNDMPFANRAYCFRDGALLADGCSVWFESTGDVRRHEGSFSVSFLIAPAGYSGAGDGLLSLFDRKKREGFYVRLKKAGRLEVGFGDGKGLYEFASLKEHVKVNVWNAVTVVFWQEAGWCDLYVNGVLSNRKQFPRHRAIRWPQETAYLLRYVDHEDYERDAPAGMYYGWIRELSMQEGALSAEQVKARHGAWPAGERKEPVIPDRRAYLNDVQRPQYHLIAPGKWMNEPHGPFYYEGYYHIFYQANPHGPIWDHIQWGHLISTDMVHWQDLPPALVPEETALDPDGCWSGSALVDREGVPRIFYTAGNDGCFPNQFVAAATAVVDESRRLMQWKKGPVPVVTQHLGWFGEFRDPYVWLEEDTYFMLVGTGDADNGGGNAVLYSSKDLKSWQEHGFFLDYDYESNHEVGHVFELPVLLPLRDESGNVVCHIFLLCACQLDEGVVETYGFLGKWEPKKRRFQRLHDQALLLDLGGGVFTGPSGFVTPDERTVLFTIAQGKRDGKDTFFSGWAHNGGLPVELSVQEGKLHIQPIRELAGLRGQPLLELRDVTLEEANAALEQYGGNRLWMRVCADAKTFAVETAGASCTRTVYYDRKAERFGVTDEAGRQLGAYRGDIDRVALDGEPICMEYFLDHSMIEVYLNGRKSVTQRNYIQGTKRTVRLLGDVETIRELVLCEMAPAYDL